MKPEIEKWCSDLTEEQRKIVLELREIVLSQDVRLREEVKWNQPCFYGNSMVCYIQKAKTHVSLGFGKGSTLVDRQGVLEGSGGRMRHVKLRMGANIEREKLDKPVKEAIALDTVA